MGFIRGCAFVLVDKLVTILIRGICWSPDKKKRGVLCPALLGDKLSVM